METPFGDGNSAASWPEAYEHGEVLALFSPPSWVSLCSGGSPGLPGAHPHPERPWCLGAVGVVGTVTGDL